MKPHQLFFAVLCATIGCAAQANPLYDGVNTAQVNGLSLTKKHSLHEVEQAFGKPHFIGKPVFSECTANHDVQIRYSNKNVRLEYFSEDTPSPLNIRSAKQKAYLWLDWGNANLLTEKITIGNVVVGEKFDGSMFRQNFPNSAKNIYGEIDNQGRRTYVVLVGDDFDDESIPYRPHVAFVFQKDVLVHLSFDQGVAC